MAHDVEAKQHSDVLVVAPKLMAVAWSLLAVLTGLSLAALIWPRWLSDAADMSGGTLCACVMWPFFNQVEARRNRWWYVPTAWIFILSYPFLWPLG